MSRPQAIDCYAQCPLASHLRTYVDAGYGSFMRALWPIERAALEATAQDFPDYADCLKGQIEAAQVLDFENTGAGFFSTISVHAAAPRLPNKSHLEGAHGSVDGIDHGMGFIVFFEDGRLSHIEGYCHANISTVDIDFATVDFNVKPWSASVE